MGPLPASGTSSRTGMKTTACIEGPALGIPRLTIDLDAIAANWRLLTELAAPAEVTAVVKADAYGLGVQPVARRLAEAGCGKFFVATLDEGIELRRFLPDAVIAV